MTDGPVDRLRENAVGITSMLVTGIWLALLFVGPGNWWLAALLFGYIVVVPIVAILYGDEENLDEWVDGHESAESVPEPNESSRKDALEILRDRYARGELTDEQFERKLDTLLDTETLEDIEDRRLTGRETELER